MAVASRVKNSEFEMVIQYVSQLVSAEAGIILGDKQKVMVETRIKSRMLSLGIDQPQSYLHYVKDHFSEEKDVLVGLLTTHHTFFFREFGHFESLLQQLPRLINSARAEGRNCLHVWSAACSRGQEVYSIAMFLEFHLKQMAPDFTYKIFGSDIDGNSVEYARNGVYRKKEVEAVPLKYLGNSWIKGTGEISDFVKIRKEIANKCSFKKINLLEFSGNSVQVKFDVIFLRNVLIYFEEEKVNTIARNVLRQMVAGGLLIVGTSETLAESALSIRRIEPNIFTHRHLASLPIVETKSASLNTAVISKPAENKRLRVLCIDDSSAVIKLLGKILTPDKGFDVVATASNGLEAIEKLKHIQVDVVTLDIHMPEMDGLTYLNQQMSKTHPPVVMISSASRSDADSALRALKLGASDFVEKPSLENLTSRADEIRSKLKTAFAFKAQSTSPSTMDIELSRKFVVTQPESKIIGVFASAGQSEGFLKYLQEMRDFKIPTVIGIEGQDAFQEALASEWGRRTGLEVKVLTEALTPLTGELYVANTKLALAFIRKSPAAKKLITIWGGCSESAEREICGSGISIISLELDSISASVRRLSKHVVTSASMTYHTKEHFSK